MSHQGARDEVIKAGIPEMTDQQRISIVNYLLQQVRLCVMWYFFGSVGQTLGRMADRLGLADGGLSALVWPILL